MHGDGEFRRFALCRRLPKRIQTHYRSKREYGQPLPQMSAAMVGSEARTAAMVDSKARIEALLAPSPEASKKRIEALLSSSNLPIVGMDDWRWSWRPETRRFGEDVLARAEDRSTSRPTRATSAARCKRPRAI